MAPVDNEWLDALWVDVATGVAVAVEDEVEVADGAEEEVVGTISDGKYSPGLNINVAFLA
jgi:hypothetical protein